MDTLKKWCNGEVREIDQASHKLFIHFTGFAAKYDEWVCYDAVEETYGCIRVQKQWRRGMNFQLNNRVDVLDQMGKWLPAGVVEIVCDDETGCQTAVKVHFVGYKPKWDELIELNETGWRRIREIGAFSSAHGWAKYNQAYRERIEYESQDVKGLVSQIKKKQQAAAAAAQAQRQQQEQASAAAKASAAHSGGQQQHHGDGSGN